MNMRLLCCVCSANGEHDIFGRIPVNVHANPNEFRFWRETIAEMIADISGIYVTKDEKNYPHKICTICVSYLKHAVTFRRQIINNDRCIRQQSLYPNSEPFNVKFLMQNDNHGGDVYDMNSTPEAIPFDTLKLELEQAFGGECDYSDDEEVDDAGTELFNYKEKSFKEDDITDFIGKSVVITIPDEMRERKCDACKQRFMLKESFDSHLKECIELKLNKFITEGYQLLTMRKSRALSANEFNRRMIFALKKMVTSLTSCYKEVSDLPSSEDKVTKKNNVFDPCEQLKRPSDEMLSLPNFLSSLEGKPNINIRKNHLLQTGASFEEQMTNKPLNIASNHFRIIDSANSANLPDLTQWQPHQPKCNRPNESNAIIAQCSQCSLSFSALQQFEEHIGKDHTKSSPNMQNKSPNEMDERNDTLNPDERNTLLQMLTNSTIKF